MLSRYTGTRYRSAADPQIVAYVESDQLHSLDFDSACEFYVAFEGEATDADRSYLGAVDRFYLMTHILHREDAVHPWLYDRCREVELEPDGYLDLWARYHFKSSTITQVGTVQELLNDPEITIAIFCHTKGIATGFVSQIMREFETNHDLRTLYPDICWLKPRSEAPVWSTGAFTIRRVGNPKEASVEGHGLVDGQPTSKHFKLRIYDDVVTIESVNTPEQVQKTTRAFEMSDNLGTQGGRVWGVGTRYSFGDTWGELLDRGVFKPRIYPATHNGKVDGTPVFLSQQEWEEKKRVQRSTLAAQMLQNPLSGKEQTFRPEWFKPWFVRPGGLNVYIMGDPSRGKNPKSDRTAISVIGIDAGGNKYFLDGACKRMKLSERWDHLKHYHKKWSKVPGVLMVKVGYERYGQQSDDEYFQERMRIDNYSFGIDELAWPNEGPGSKKARVERLQPDIEYGDFLFPGIIHVPGQGDSLWEADLDAGQMRFKALNREENGRRIEGKIKSIEEAKARGQGYLACEALKRKNEDGELYDLTRTLMEQLLYFPFATFDDLIDSASRIYDMFPTNALMDDRVPMPAATAD